MCSQGACDLLSSAQGQRLFWNQKSQDLGVNSEPKEAPPSQEQVWEGQAQCVTPSLVGVS